MNIDDLPERYHQQVISQLANPIKSFQIGQSDLSGMIVASAPVEEESVLHEDIRKACAIRGWLPLHGSMAHRAFRTKGEWDFVIIAEWPRLFLVECKDREGKVTKEQAALAAWATRLGWRPTVCRSMAEFWTYIASFPPIERPAGSIQEAIQ